VSIDGVLYTCAVEQPMPKGEWLHIAGAFDSAQGHMVVHLNGQVAGEAEVPARALTPDAYTRLTIGRDPHTPTLGAFEKRLHQWSVG